MVICWRSRFGTNRGNREAGICLSGPQNEQARRQPGNKHGRRRTRNRRISGDGNLVAFVSNRPDGVGLSDILIFDRSAGRLVATPELNFAQRELNPAWSADGKQLAFVSDRPRWSRRKRRLCLSPEPAAAESLPQVNSVAHEQSPSLTRDGRFLVFVSERVRGEGERDIYLWDRSRADVAPNSWTQLANRGLRPQRGDDRRQRPEVVTFTSVYFSLDPNTVFTGNSRTIPKIPCNKNVRKRVSELKGVNCASGTNQSAAVFPASMW